MVNKETKIEEVPSFLGFMIILCVCVAISFFVYKFGNLELLSQAPSKNPDTSNLIASEKSDEAGEENNSTPVDSSEMVIGGTVNFDYDLDGKDFGMEAIDTSEITKEIVEGNKK